MQRFTFLVSQWDCLLKIVKLKAGKDEAPPPTPTLHHREDRGTAPSDVNRFQLLQRDVL